MILAIFVMSFLFIPNALSLDLYENAKSSTVLIASYNTEGKYIGRGSGFYVDEGIIITNIHVIYGAARYYRVFSTNADGTAFDEKCFQTLGRGDIKINLEDDVAYIRAFIDCPHGVVYFSDKDPVVGDDLQVLGYPAIGTGGKLYTTPGLVVGKTAAIDMYADFDTRWIVTSAKIHGGNSGGPVLSDGMVVGIAVAAHLDSAGNPLDGVIIPVSVIRQGLENANDSSFGYTPQDLQKNTIYQSLEKEQRREELLRNETPFNPIPASGNIVKKQDCVRSLGEGGEDTGYTSQQGQACRCKGSYHENAARTTCLPGSPEYMEELAEQKLALERRRREKSLSQPTSRYVFSDIRSSHEYGDAITWGKDTQVIAGYPDGSFQPDRTVNRAEFLKIIIGALPDVTLNANIDDSGFPDVDETAWYGPYVRYAKRYGIIEGYPDGTFRPEHTVNFAEALKMSYETLNVRTKRVLGPWYTRYLDHAIKNNILFDFRATMDSDMSRKDVIWIVWKLSQI